MKKIKILFSTLCVFAFVVLNFSVSRDGIGADDLTLSNLSALQASAGEMWCDQSNDVDCRITVGNSTGYSKGYLRVIF